MRLPTHPFLLLLAGAAVGALLGAGATYARLGRRTPSPADRWASFRQEQLAKGGRIFEVLWQGTPMTFVLQDCSIYIADVAADGTVDRSRVLKTGFYLLPTACTRQSLHAESEYLVAELANRAIGAGGGNTTGGTYRSKDGRVWEKQIETGWKSVDEAQ